MSSDIRMIGFRPDAKTERLIDAERERLTEQSSGAKVTRSMAVRSLICKTSTITDKPHR